MPIISIGQSSQLLQLSPIGARPVPTPVVDGVEAERPIVGGGMGRIRSPARQEVRGERLNATRAEVGVELPWDTRSRRQLRLGARPGSV